MSKVAINESTLTAIGDAIREKTGGTDLIAPGDMPQAIQGIIGAGLEPIVLTGSATKAFTGQFARYAVEHFADYISTNNLISIMDLAAGTTTITHIPCDLNMYPDYYATKYADLAMERAFYNAQGLQEVPRINNGAPGLDGLCEFFNGCSNLREIPDDYGEGWDWTRLQKSGQSRLNAIFATCFSLRNFPSTFAKNIYGRYDQGNYTLYSAMANYCYVLDEITNLVVIPNSLSNNPFINTINQNYRLKNFTFEINEDGSPKTAKWSKAVLDFTQRVGYGPSGTSWVVDYNSGITVDKEVKDDATYQALKNDPDWFTCKVEYSRYNHDSAVATINSLPDTTAYLAEKGGTNTIKFKGAAGSATDGGAINTLTEEEIAVAAAKGWTVTLV